MSGDSCITPQSIPLPSSVPLHPAVMSQARLFSWKTGVPCLGLAALWSSSRSGPRTARNLPLSCQPCDRRQRRVSRRDAFQSQRTLVLSLSQALCNNLSPRRSVIKLLKLICIIGSLILFKWKPKWHCSQQKRLSQKPKDWLQGGDVSLS